VSVVAATIKCMAQLTPLETRILEYAEKREQGSKRHTLDEFGWRETTYTMQLLQLIRRPEVEADQRWTMLVHRIRKVSAEAVQRRTSRSFGRTA
jgi:hypothetical protein